MHAVSTDEIMVQGHDGKAGGSDDGIHPADGADGGSVFFMTDSQGLESALETVDEVDAEDNRTDDIDKDEPPLLEGDVDAAIDILDGFGMAGVGDHRQLIRKAHLDPEVAHVEAEEGENEDPEQGHVFGSPGSSCHTATLVAHAFRFPVFLPEKDTLNGMQEDAGV